MRPFKSFDLFVQLILFVSVIIAFITGDPEKINPLPLILAFAGMQIISILVNLTYGPHSWKKISWRKYHLIGTALVIAGIVLALVQSSAARTGDKDDKYSMAGLETMLYLTIPAILLALFYSFITLVEWKNMKKS